MFAPSAVEEHANSHDFASVTQQRDDASYAQMLTGGLARCLSRFS
jgi:hypothetical protein